MKKTNGLSKVLVTLIAGSFILTGCGKSEGVDVLKGKTFEATQNGDNEYLLTFRDDGTLQVKENGDLGRTDEGEYKVSEKKDKKGYYKVTFDKLDQNAGYVDEKPEAGYWYLDKDKENNPMLRNVEMDCSEVNYFKSGKDRGKCHPYVPSKEKEKKRDTEIEDSGVVYLKEK